MTLEKNAIPAGQLRKYEFVCPDCGEIGRVTLAATESEYSGMQCGDCWTIVWFEGRNAPILSELNTQPSTIGSGYLEHRERTISRFARSLPACPECGGRFERLVTNVPEHGVWCKQCKRNTNVQSWHPIPPDDENNPVWVLTWDK